MKKYISLSLMAFLIFSCQNGIVGSANPGDETGTISSNPVISLIIGDDTKVSKGIIEEEVNDVIEAVLSVEAPDGSVESQKWEKGVTGNQFNFIINTTGLHIIRIVETDTGQNSYKMEKQVNIQKFRNYKYRVVLGGNIEITIDDSDVEENIAYINTYSTEQYIRGFGGAGILGWRPEMTEDQITTAFSVEDGLGLSVLRVRIPPDSTEWEAEIPVIEGAKSYGATVIASAWTAPAEMKTNEDLVGGTLKPESYADYAAHLKGFNDTVGGVFAISPINEPNIVVTYESMEMEASEVADFVAAEGLNCGAPIMAPEPYNMSQDYINEYLSNTAAADNTTYIAGHIYGADLTSFDPGKEVWMTEHYIGSATTGNDWEKSMKVAKEIHTCMDIGYSMYIWWYLVRYYGPIDEDGTITKVGYVMSHYAKWVRPGFNKITSTINPADGIYITAYKKDSDLVIVAINQNEEVVSQTFNISGKSISGLYQYTTTAYHDQAAGSSPVISNNFTVDLRASSITTFVSSLEAVPNNPLAPEVIPEPEPEPELGELTVELESLSDQDLFSPFEVVDDSDASGGQAVVWPDNDNSYLVPADDEAGGQLDIDFTLTEAANVGFQIRVNMTNGSNDSFYFKLDSGTWFQSGQVTDGYELLTIDNDIFDDLEAGSHTLTLQRREDGALLDKVILTSDAGIGTIY